MWPEYTSQSASAQAVVEDLRVRMSVWAFTLYVVSTVVAEVLSKAYRSCLAHVADVYVNASARAPSCGSWRASARSEQRWARSRQEGGGGGQSF